MQHILYTEQINDNAYAKKNQECFKICRVAIVHHIVTLDMATISFAQLGWTNILRLSQTNECQQHINPKSHRIEINSHDKKYFTFCMQLLLIPSHMLHANRLWQSRLHFKYNIFYTLQAKIAYRCLALTLFIPLSHDIGIYVSWCHWKTAFISSLLILYSYRYLISEWLNLFFYGLCFFRVHSN